MKPGDLIGGEESFYLIIIDEAGRINLHDIVDYD
jgi:hypothetical protein